MSESMSNDPQTLVIGARGSISSTTLSPLKTGPAGGVARWMYSSLFRFEDDLTLSGDVVRDWEVSEDGLEYILHLRDDVYWHDGQQLTARDVVYSAELLQQPHRAFRNMLFIGGEPVVFDEIDEFTVKITSPQPYVHLPAYLTPVWGSLFLLVPEHILRNGDEAAFAQNPVGTGPFIFDGITDDGSLKLRANDRYFGDKPRVERVLLKFYDDNQERANAFERGELDVLLFPHRLYSDEDAKKFGGRLYETSTNSIIQFAINCRHPLFQSVKVRQAIAHALDRRSMVQDIEGPGTTVSKSPIGPDYWPYEPDLTFHEFDPERSRQLLAEEGWEADENGHLVKDGQAFQFSAIFQPDPWNHDFETYALRIQEYLRAVGIEMELRPSEYWSVIKPAWREQSFEAFLMFDTFYVEPDLYWSWHTDMKRRPAEVEVTGGLPQYGYGVTGYSNPAVDKLIEDSRGEFNKERRGEILREIQRILADEVASVWLHNRTLRNVVHDRVNGLSQPSVADGTADLIVLLHPERLGKS